MLGFVVKRVVVICSRDIAVPWAGSANPVLLAPANLVVWAAPALQDAVEAFSEIFCASSVRERADDNSVTNKVDKQKLFPRIDLGKFHMNICAHLTV